MSDIRFSNVIAEPFYPIHRSVKENSDLSEVWCKGGRGSTKSSFISLEIMFQLMKDQTGKSHAVAFRRYDNELRDSVLGQFEWAAEKLGCYDKWRFMTSPMRAIYNPTGQKIYCKGADNPKKVKSINPGKGYIKYMWFEEVDQFGGMEDIRNITQSMFRGEHSGRVSFFSYNPPKSSRSWVNQEVTIPKAGRIIHHSDYTQVPREWLGQRFIADAEHIRRINESAYRHEYLGEETGTGLEVFTNVTVREISKEERESFDNIRQGLDFGYAVDPVCFLRMNYNRKKRTLHIFNEVSGIGYSNRVLADKLNKEWKREQTVADSAEPKSISELRDDYGCKIKGAKKGKGSIEHGIKWLADLEEIIIDPITCPLAAKEYVNYSLEQTRDGQVISRYPDKENHAIDTSRYALEDDMKTESNARVADFSASAIGV